MCLMPLSTPKLGSMRLFHFTGSTLWAQLYPPTLFLAFSASSSLLTQCCHPPVDTADAFWLFSSCVFLVWQTLWGMIGVRYEMNRCDSCEVWIVWLLPPVDAWLLWLLTLVALFRLRMSWILSDRHRAALTGTWVVFANNNGHQCNVAGLWFSGWKRLEIFGDPGKAITEECQIIHVHSRQICWNARQGPLTNPDEQKASQFAFKREINWQVGTKWV